MERGAERILQLIEEGKQAEAVALMNTETWGIEEQGNLASKGHSEYWRECNDPDVQIVQLTRKVK